MKQSVVNKLESLVERFEEVQALLGDPSVIGSQDKFRNLSKEYSQLEAVVTQFGGYQSAQKDVESALEMIQENDPEIKQMAQEELKDSKARVEELEMSLQILLLPKDPKDDNSCFLEIRAGAGGDEAAIFAGDLFRMYSRYAESRGWRVEVISSSPADVGGFKEIIFNMTGEEAYKYLKFESGVHRVQRVPATETQGRIHTSTATVAVLPEAEEVDIQINPGDLDISTMRASGAGGQHVNTTDSAVMMVHKPTGVTVYCADERSQIKNRAKAMGVMRARLLQAKIDEENAKYAAERKGQIGSGDRSERIRTYNYPQGRLTDHRIGMNLSLPPVIDGDVEELIQALQHYDYEARIQNLLESQSS